MESKLLKSFNKFFHDMSILELQIYNDKTYDKYSYHDNLYVDLIRNHPNEYTSTQIADLLKVSRPAVTQKINDLIKKGLLKRTQSETDKRIYYLSLSDEKMQEENYFIDDTKNIENKTIEKFGCEKINIFCEMLEYISEEYLQLQSK